MGNGEEDLMPDNTISQIKAFFDSDEKPVKTAELMEFWKSLTDEEKEYYKTVDLRR